METNTNKNLEFIDKAKFFGLFLVVFAHIISQNTLLSQVIFYFHMPLFFIISGYLYKQKEKVIAYKTLLWGLIVPYFLYQIIYSPLVFFKNLVIFHEQPFILFIKIINGILVGNVAFSDYFYTVCGPCWFIMTTFIIRFIFINLKLEIKNLAVLSIIAIILLRLSGVYEIILPFTLNSVLLAFPFCTIGFIIRKYDIISNKKSAKMSAKLFALGGGDNGLFNFNIG